MCPGRRCSVRFSYGRSCTHSCLMPASSTARPADTLGQTGTAKHNTSCKVKVGSSDPFMPAFVPALYSLAQQPALEEVKHSCAMANGSWLTWMMLTASPRRTVLGNFTRPTRAHCRPMHALNSTLLNVVCGMPLAKSPQGLLDCEATTA